MDHYIINIINHNKDKMEKHNYFEPAITYRNNLDLGRTQFGISITFNDSLLSEAIADNVDFLWYDLEHNMIDPSTLNSHLLSCRSKKTFSLVRIGDHKPSSIKPVLDAGANGIIASQINSLEEAVAFCNNCRYPPEGKRGVGPRVPSNYRPIDPTHFEQANKSIFVAVMIETMGAFNAIDDIVQINNLDSIVIGPYDLSGAIHKLGDVHNTVVQEAIEHIIITAKKYKKFIGIGMPINVKYAQKMVSLGVDWVQIGSDYEYILSHSEDIMSRLK
jgi:4-hydroxy-2-oxoheptanedioate aldolase